MERFWSKVSRRGSDECWEWTGAISAGYGTVRWNGKNTTAHRVAWELTHGPIAEGLVVRHLCRGQCCNPAHLELGTHAQNMRDTIRDGTVARGERHWKSNLTDAQVRDIKRRLESYTRGLGKQLAEEYGVSAAAISTIKLGQRWTHV